MKYPNGNIYEGELVNGIPKGQGKLRWKDGKIWNGVFQEGLLNGTGKETL